MIDLHSHILPGIDDGAPDLETAVAMARMAVADGIHHCVCTPHILPGLHDNDTTRIAARLAVLRNALSEAGVSLTLSLGAEVHLAPRIVDGLAEGSMPLLGHGRAVLLELPAMVMPRNAVSFTANLLCLGYRPVLAHPERLRWIELRYDAILAMRRQGVAMQLTAGALLGQMGSRARYWAERMLEEGQVDVLATDAHNLTTRPPLLSAARDAVALRLGEAEATAMVETRPAELIGAPVVEETDFDPAHLSADFILALRARFVEIGGLA